MTYDDVASWVEENFVIGNYLSPKELIEDVKQRFQQDGMYFPDQAGANINSKWREAMGLDQYQAESIEELQRQRYEEVQREMESKFRFFLEEQPETQYYEPVVYEPTEPVPQEPQATQEQAKGFTGVFRNIGSRIRSIFRRK